MGARIVMSWLQDHWRQDGPDSIHLAAEQTIKSHPQVAASSILGAEAHAVDPVEVQIRNLSVELLGNSIRSSSAKWLNCMPAKSTPQPQPKNLLRSVTADFRPGSLTAIIGASGSGKTTLLDAMSGRLTGNVRISGGTVAFNAESNISSVRHAHVTQQDVLLPTLTVRETLRYAADLRLPPPISGHQRYKVVEHVINELGLQRCANTRIGNSQVRGCSGGEKRRVSIGVQLLANPSLLFLDEPTTGLDAASALTLSKTIRGLAQRGRAVVMTIHQPRPELWSLFDNLIVLACGSPVYSGAVTGALPWFLFNGLTRPPYINPADFIIDASAIDHRNSNVQRESRVRIDNLHSAWSVESQRHFSSVSALKSPWQQNSSHTRGSLYVSSWRQIHVLTKRTLVVTCRDPLGITASLTEAVLMGLAIGYIFYDMGDDQAGIKSRQGCLYVAASLQGYLMLIFETYRMTLDIPTFDREASDRCVSPLAFMTSRRLAKLLIEDLPVPVILSTMSYFMSGLDRQVAKVFTFYVITILNHYLAVLCATTCVVISRDFPTASLIASVIYTLQSLASGLIIQVDTMPVYVAWTRWITYSFYTFSAYIGNEFEGNFYDCPLPGGRENPDCVQFSGDFVIRALGFPANWTGRAIACMGGFAFFFNLFSVLGLHYMRPTSFDKPIAPQPREEPPASDCLTVQQPRQSARPVPVELQNFALNIEVRSFKSIRNGPELKSVLKSTSARFEPGTLNIILGPSGSGKSSLLNSIAQRHRNTLRTKYLPSGQITFDGVGPSDLMLKYMCAYVHQDGDLLLPALSVRETLRFAAALRLSRSLSLGEKRQRADELLVKLGLTSCADTLIGGENFRGISGGERRRVSLAIQILNDPQVLLVDEPTSGLDAFTANSIVKVLHDLATEGRTVIITIHQPRSDLFAYFGNILLLSEGGAPVYSGPAGELVQYFADCGHDCPAQTNPADFALDLVTQFHRHHPDGEESQHRVQRLVDLWKERPPFIKPMTAHALEGTESSASEASHDGNLGVDRQNRTRTIPLHARLPQLLRRAMNNTVRQPQLLLARIMQSCGVAILFALFFAPLGNDYESIQTRFGLFQQVGGFYIIGMLTNVAVYPAERDVAYREIEDGANTVNAFLAAYTIVELPFEIVNSLIFGLLLVFAIGLPHTVSNYFVVCLAGFTGLSCGESLGIMFNTLFSHTGFAINLMGVLLAVANSMAGVLSLDMPPLFEAFNYLSPIRYQVRGIAHYSLKGISFNCELEGGCPIRTGEEALKLYKFDESPVFSVVGLVTCIVVYRLLAWLLLKVMR